MLVKVTLTETQNIQFLNSKAEDYGIPEFCGPTEITWNPSPIPNYLSMASVDTGPTTLTLTTNDPTQIGVFSQEFTVCLPDFPQVACITKNFDVTIICEVFTLSWTSIPADIFIEPGATPQP